MNDHTKKEIRMMGALIPHDAILEYPATLEPTHFSGRVCQIIKEVLKITKVLVIGDTHIGGSYSLAKEETVLESSNKISSNQTQTAIREVWEEMIDDVGVVDLLILNGDLVEGINYCGEGSNCLTTDMSQQRNDAVDIISEIKFKKVVGCSGTNYHVKHNPSVDKLVIEGLGGKCMDEVSIKVHDTRIYANHRTPVRMSQWDSRPQSIAKDILLGELNVMDFGHYDIICKSHAHYYLALDMGTTIGFVCPCFKGRDDYAKKSVNPFAFNPSIGYVSFDIETDGTFSWSRVAKHLKYDDAIKTYNIKSLPIRKN